MARPPSAHPTELELQILKILWQADEALSVQSVRECLAAAPLERPLSHSSVITIMNIMVRKGQLSRAKRGKAYIYSPCISQQDVHQGMLGDLVDRVFDGSAGAVMLELLHSADIDEDELKKLRQLINRKVKGKSK